MPTSFVRNSRFLSSSSPSYRYLCLESQTLTTSAVVHFSGSMPYFANSFGRLPETSSILLLIPAANAPKSDSWDSSSPLTRLLRSSPAGKCAAT